MAILELELRNDLSAYSYRVDLEGSTYNLEFEWSTRARRWTIHLSSNENEPLLSTALVVNRELLRRFNDERYPPGLLYLIDMTGQAMEAGEKSLGDTHLLFYEESTE